MYKGIELNEADINRVIDAVGAYGKEVSNYSTDLQQWDELSNKVKSDLLQGITPEFTASGTGMTLGGLDIQGGKTNQNIFGNWTDKKLGRAFTDALKQGMDQLIPKAESAQGIGTTVPTASTEASQKII